MTAWSVPTPMCTVRTHTTAMLASKVVRELAMLLLFCAAAYALSSTLVPLFLRTCLPISPFRRCLFMAVPGGLMRVSRA